MSTINERIKHRRKLLGLTQEALAKTVGVSQASIHKLEEGMTKRPRNILELAKALDCTADWLLYGDTDSLTNNVQQGPDVKGFFPLISWVQAGAFTEHALVDFDEMERYPCTSACSQNTFVLRVSGNSMEPRFFADDLIFVDPELKHPASGKFVVARLEGTNEATFKQYVEIDGKSYLKALNPDYPADARFININGNCQIVGTVVSVVREL